MSLSSAGGIPVIEVLAIFVATAAAGAAVAGFLWRIVADMKSDLRQDMANFKADLSNAVTATRTEARADVQEVRAAILPRRGPTEPSDPYPPEPPERDDH